MAKTYEKTKVMNKKLYYRNLRTYVCATGGKITIKEHGQTAEVTQQNVRNADPKEQQNINPLFDYKEFQDEQNRI